VFELLVKLLDRSLRGLGYNGVNFAVIEVIEVHDKTSLYYCEHVDCSSRLYCTNGRAYASVVSVCLSSVTYIHVLRLNGASYRKKQSEETNKKWPVGIEWSRDR